MPSTSVANPVAINTDAAGLAPAPVMDSVAARVRPCGLFLAMLKSDGSVVYHDRAAGLFFQRFVLPLLQYPEQNAEPLRAQLRRLAPESPVTTWNVLPGVLLAAFPCVEKRTVTGAILIAARSPAFRLTEDVLRVCGRLGVDGGWLLQQAQSLPAFTDDALHRQVRVAVSMVRDQLRLGALERELTSLSTQLANSYEELSLIYQISGGMKINRRAGEFFKQVCLDVLEVVPVRGMGVALSHAAQVQHQDPLLYGPLSLPPGDVHRLADQLLDVLGKRQAPLLVNDLSADKTFSWLSSFAKQLLAVPLQRQDQVLGCLFAIDKNQGEFDSVDSKLLNSIANESAIYLENAVLFEDVHGLMMGLLHALTSAVDAKDAYTCGHSERVALLSRNLAKQAGLSEHDVERIYMAGLLHDVGKIGVPESVLQKTGRLTPEEFEQMKKHPEIGARILRDIAQIRDIIPGVLHHHERYDGKGYPSGLAGESIPLMGRIICLADCFDAMTSNRTYRKALPLEVALEEIRKCAGTQFDPHLAQCFLDIGLERLEQLLAAHERQSRTLVDLQQTIRAA